MKAIFEVKFKKSFMASEAEVKEIGGWFKMIEYLYKEDGLGIFAEDFVFKRVEK